MKLHRLLLPCLFALLAGLTALPADDASTPGSPSLAQRIVSRAAAVREKDSVEITGTPADVELLEELAVEVRRRGAHPLITLNSDRLRRRMIRDVPARFDDQPPKLDLALAGLIDVRIGVEALDEGALVGLPASRMTAQQKAAEAVGEKLLARNVRTVWLGNGLYPTASRAKRFGLTQPQLRQVYEAGLAVDPASLQAAGARIQKTMSAGKEMRLRSEAGTDLTMRITTRPVLVSDGVLTADKEKKGGAAVLTWLPAGEVYVTPVPGSAEGVVLAPLTFWEGQEIRKLKLTFKAGKLTSMSAESGLERLEKVYRAHGTGKEQLGAIDVGINPGVKIPEGSKLVSFVAAGTVTVALGNNTWAGGNVTSPFGLNCHLGDTTLQVDGKAVVSKGKLVR